MSYLAKSLLLFVLTVFIIDGCALPFDRFDAVKINKNPRRNLFKIISDIPYDIFDITAMYRDVTAEERTVGCSGNCRTPIALWVLQSISPCTKILKEDCSRGLVCCVREKKKPIEKIRSEASTIDNTTTLYISPSDNELNSVEFAQDPIPGDSSEETVYDP